MSSAVNKSNTRFKPKALGRSAPRPSAARLSGLRSSFASSDNKRPSFSELKRPVLVVPEQQPAVEEAIDEPKVTLPLPKGQKEVPAQDMHAIDHKAQQPMVSATEPQQAPEPQQAAVPQPVQAQVAASSVGIKRSAEVASLPPLEEPVEAEVAAIVSEIPTVDEQGRQLINPEDVDAVAAANADDDSHADRAINPVTFTMAALCKDIPVGVPNARYHRFEQARLSRKRYRARLLQAKKMMRGEYQPRSAELRKELEELYDEHQAERLERFGNGEKADGYDALNAIDQQPLEHQTMKLQLGKDGQILLDEQSQTIDRHAQNRADDADSRGRAKEVDAYATVINSYSFSNKERPERWTVIETDKFYQALSVWGTDFNLIAQMFPNRTRQQIKTKFKYEERRNMEKLQLYLVHRRKIKVEDYSKVCGREIGELGELEESLQKLRQEHEEKLKVEEAFREMASAEDKKRQQQSLDRRPGRKIVVKRERR